MTAIYAIIGLVALLIGGGIFFYVSGRKAGGNKVAADVAENTADNLRRQDKAQAEARGEEVVDRLRRGGF